MNYYLGQIGTYGFNFAPRGWAFCNGNIIAIAQNTALYSLIGTTYGGNGQTTFGLPDLRSRTPICYDGNYPIGEMAGVENVTLLQTEMPVHTHQMGATNTPANIAGDGAHILAIGGSGNPVTAHNAYIAGTGPNVSLNPAAVGMAGGNQPHNNLQPLLVLNYCIATTGYYPARN
ncbi:MAG TPA: tail fiber protein [Rhizomicrobium sp.]|jgi:microcystin-dependent protein|nr:tail fiber protein [Rhizomicrobium sp.]